MFQWDTVPCVEQWWMRENERSRLNHGWLLSKKRICCSNGRASPSVKPKLNPRWRWTTRIFSRRKEIDWTLILISIVRPHSNSDVMLNRHEFNGFDTVRTEIYPVQITVHSKIFLHTIFIIIFLSLYVTKFFLLLLLCCYL